MLVLLLTLLCFFGLSLIQHVRHEEISPKKKRSADKGFYVTAYVVQTPSFFNRLKTEAKQAGLNTIVVDAKHFLEGELLLLVKARKCLPGIRVSGDEYFTKVIKGLQKEGFIVSARIVVFKDDHLVIARPDLGIRVKSEKKEGGVDLYQDLKGGKWADPYNAEVRLYNALIAERAALCGVDEVQFDYIRFPAERRARETIYPGYQEGKSKIDMIEAFLSDVRQRLKKYNVSIAVDIFGVTAWQSKNDIASLGQDLKRLAKHIDVISPMLYPSHFHAGYDGFANPGSEPYYFVAAGIKKTREILSTEAVAVVPWIQGFNLRSPNYGPQYIADQVKACKDAGATGYLIWNASNRYETAFSGLRN